MAGGEVQFRVFNRVADAIQTTTRLDIPAFQVTECCFQLPVLAELVGTDEFKNDKHSILKRYDKNLFDSVSSVKIYIQKYENGAFVDKVTPVDDSNGEWYEYSTFTNSEQTLYYVGLIADWQKILINYGEGNYRFRFAETDYAAVVTESFYPFEFCLQQYNQYRADKTTRFTTYTKGYRGDYLDDKDIWDFTNVVSIVGGEGWFQQMRLPNSFFGGNKSAYEREYVKYSNGQQVYLKDEQVENYTWYSGLYPAQLHNWIKTDILQSDSILVTDYNSNNPNLFNNKEVHPNSNYEPRWNYNNLKAFVDVDFTQEFQNRRKKRC